MDLYQISAKPRRIWRPTLVDMRNLLNTSGIPPLDSNFLMDSYKIIIWNCRSAGNDRFKSNFTELVRQHRPEIVALLETKIPL